MVRTIDGDERRRLLAEAVWRIIRRDGFDAASVRAVAAEVELSAGSVRHFFDTQDGLHVFAMEELIRTISERATSAARTGLGSQGEAAAPRGEGIPSARQRVVAALRELLPLTAETVELYRAHLQFVVRSMVNPALVPVAQQGFDALQSFYRQLLGLLVEAGAARPDLDLEAVTDELAVLVDGIVLRQLVTPDLLGPGAALDLVDRFLDRLAADVVEERVR